MQIKSIAGRELWSGDHKTIRETIVTAVIARANLARADLAGADLTGADLTGADLTGAKISEGITVSRAPIQVAGLCWYVMIWDAHMRIGCEFHSLAEWSSFDDRRIVQMDRGALKFWRAHKAALFALAASDGRWKDAS